MSDIHSFHMFGRGIGGQGIFIQPCDPDVVPSILDGDTLAILNDLMERQGTTLVGVIRSMRQSDGSLSYFHSFASDEHSEADELLKDNALLIVVSAERNPADPMGEARRVAEDCELLAALGLGD